MKVWPCRVTALTSVTVCRSRTARIIPIGTPAYNPLENPRGCRILIAPPGLRRGHRLEIIPKTAGAGLESPQGILMRKLIAITAALVTLSGCYVSKKKDDRPWPSDVVSRIEVGKTTKAEVLMLLGPPKQVIRLLESEAYMYVASVEKNS